MLKIFESQKSERRSKVVLDSRQPVPRSFHEICLSGDVAQVIDYIKSGKEYCMNETEETGDHDKRRKACLNHNVYNDGFMEVAILFAELRYVNLKLWSIS